MLKCRFSVITFLEEKVTFPSAPKSVLDCAANKKIAVGDKGFAFDFKSARGKLFLVEF